MAASAASLESAMADHHVRKFNRLDLEIAKRTNLEIVRIA
jgi:hypothetical protein